MPIKFDEKAFDFSLPDRELSNEDFSKQVKLSANEIDMAKKMILGHIIYLLNTPLFTVINSLK